MTEEELQKVVITGLHEFYQRKLQKLTGLDLKTILLQVNPYLLKSKGEQGASNIVEFLLQAYVSFSEEQIFSDFIFDPLINMISAENALNGTGIDESDETDEENMAKIVHRSGSYISIATDKNMNYIESSQKFWLELTGDNDFYLKILKVMGDYPQKNRIKNNKDWSNTINRLSRDFIINFCAEDGSIIWENIFKFYK